MHPKFIVACNFKEFLIYDMETLKNPQKILLEELPQKFHAFDFLIDSSKDKLRIEWELSLQAGEIVGKLYDALHVQYINPDSDESLQSLNKLCVRLKIYSLRTLALLIGLIFPQQFLAQFLNLP